MSVTHNSKLSTPNSPLTTHHSPLTTHHSPLTTHHSPLTTHHSPANAPQVAVGANEDLAVGDGWGRETGCAEGVAADHFKAGACLEDIGDAVVVGQVEMSVGDHRRAA